MRMKFCNRKCRGILLDQAIRGAMDSYLERLQQAIASATRGMTSDELTRHAEGKWCVAEILEHLYLTYTGTQKAFERCLKAGKPLARSSHFQTKSGRDRGHRLRIFSRGTEIARSGPSPGHVRGKSRGRHRSPDCRHGQAHHAMRRALWLAHKVLDHPVLGPLTARQWRKFHLAHGRHHVKQILQRRPSAAPR